MIRRLAAAVLILSLAAALLFAAWPQLFGLESLPVVAQVVSLRGLSAAVAGLLALVLLVLAVAVPPFRRLGAALAILLVAFVAVTAAVLATRGFGDPSFDAADDDGLTVLAWNTLGDATGPQAVADVAIEAGADIVSLPETTEEVAIEVASAMKAAGHPMWVHSVSQDHISKARTTSLLTSIDLGTYSVDRSRGDTSVVPTVIVTPDDGTGPTIIAAHSVAPVPGYFDMWADDLRWLKSACSGGNIIMAGDLNSTVDHYGDLANTPESTIGDCADAASATGSGAVGTWPAALPAPLGSPIDHVMSTSNWRATGTTVILDRDGAGSDHRPIVVQLQPKG